MKSATLRVLAAVLFGLAAHSAVAGRYNTIMNIGDPMPEFKNLPTADGGTLSSGDITQSAVVMVSLANHCPWVQGMDPDLVKLTREFKDKDVRFIGLSFNHMDSDRLPAMEKQSRIRGYTFSYVYDDSQDLGRKLGATRTPEYFVFDQDRKLVYMGLLYNSPAKKSPSGEIQHINGAPNVFYVRDAVNATLAGKPVEVAETRAQGCTVKYVN